ncbi:MAG: transglycosylase domain-containing protein, partial [Gemmatimonadales bacterium]
ARDNVAAGRVVAGGSTITLQTARLLTGAPRTLAGKVRQILWALRLDAHLAKATILEQYLNRVPLGQGAVGVEAAAALYFGGTAREVSLGQAALLAALASAPSRDNPLIDSGRARVRRALVLRRLAATGYAGPEDVARAAAEPLVALERTTPFLAPHFTTRFLARADDTPHTAPPPDGVARTSLDLGLQREVEAEVRHAVDVLRDRVVAHAAAVVLDNPTGDILAWVGSPDFFADTAGQVDMVVSPRQPGSALKPFLYGLAFDRGYTAASVLPDVPRTYHTSLGPYRPRNYDRRFRGPVRAREALASSYNIPAVELVERLGTGALLRTLHLAGFASLDRTPEFYGLGLALGNGDVTLLELANGYRALANAGVWRVVVWRSDGRADGRADRPADRPPVRVMSPQAAALVLDILADPAARVPAFGLNTPLDLPFRAAAKTGTSRHFTDNWAVATTVRFTVAVWVGNFSGRPMQGVGGITGAGPLLHRVALRVARRYAPGSLPTPDAVGAVPRRVCRLSGLAATPDCPTLVEWFAPGTEPEPRGMAPRVERAGFGEPRSMAPRAERAGFGESRGMAPGFTHPDSTGEVFRISSP